MIIPLTETNGFVKKIMGKLVENTILSGRGMPIDREWVFFYNSDRFKERIILTIESSQHPHFRKWFRTERMIRLSLSEKTAWGRR